MIIIKFIAWAGNRVECDKYKANISRDTCIKRQEDAKLDLIENPTDRFHIQRDVDPGCVNCKQGKGIRGMI